MEERPVRTPEERKAIYLVGLAERAEMVGEKQPEWFLQLKKLYKNGFEFRGIIEDGKAEFHSKP